jgi:hypothetical protein
MFTNVSFGVPDWDAGNRVLQTSTVDVGRWAADVNAAFPAPAPPPVTALSGTPEEPAMKPEQLAKLSSVDKAFFHIEIFSAGETRNLSLHKTGPSTSLNTAGPQRLNGVPVRITTDPSGATLTIEGDAEQHCQSPCVFSLAPSKQVVHSEMAGYRSETRTFEPKPTGSEMQILLEPEMGSIKLDAPQSDTEVLINGQTAARQVPVVLQLPLGKYQIRSVQDGKVLNQQEVEVTITTTPIIQVKK